MNFDGLKEWQPEHTKKLYQALLRYQSFLDASDTGTGKTYTTLAILRHLEVVPLVLGPKNSRIGWERASAHMKTPLEFVNYEKIRGRRQLMGGTLVDSLVLSQQAGEFFTADCVVKAFYKKRLVLSKRQSWSDAATWVNLGMQANKQPLVFMPDPGQYDFQIPFTVDQQRLTKSDWVVEKPYGSGSFLQWKNAYEAIVFDEVHRCGGGKTLNSKLLIAARRQARFVMTLSATAADDPGQMKALGFALGLHSLNGANGYRPWLLRHGYILDRDTKRVSFSLDTKKQSKAFLDIHKAIFPAHGARMRKQEIPGFPRSQIDVKLLSFEKAEARILSIKLHNLYVEYGKEAQLSGLWVDAMQKLELLMVPDICDLVMDMAAEMRMVVFVSYTATLHAVVDQLRRAYGEHQIGWIDGSQTARSGEAERTNYLNKFQDNKLVALVVNSAAGSESMSLHDPTGRVERGVLVTPQDSGRRLKQLLGRVDRAGGANSLQLLLYFADTEQEKTAARVKQRLTNLDLLNDADLII